MEKEGVYKIKPFYQGGYSTLDPSKADIVPGIQAGQLGLTTDARTANQIKEVSTKLSSGVKQIEIEMVTPQVFDSVPKQQFKEINRLSKLTGIDVSVHGPVIDTTGISKQGYDELDRKNSERVIINTIERSHDINPEGNVPVTFHSSEGIPGTEFETLGDAEERKARKLIAVNRKTGEMIPLKQEEKFYPDMRELKPGIREKIEKGQIKEISKKEHYRQIPLEQGKKYLPEENLDMHNKTLWDNQMFQVLVDKKRADEIIEQNQAYIDYLQEGLATGRLKKENLEEPAQQKGLKEIKRARTYLEDIEQHVNARFNEAYKYGSNEQKKLLENISKEYQKQLNARGNTIEGQSEAMQFLITELKRPELAPDLFVPIEKFAVEKSSETYGNAAFEAYKKFGDSTPIVSIENPPAGHALSTGEDLKNLVEASRKKFAKRLIEEKNISKRKADKLAEKFIGATWDVGHINMLRKQGFESKDIIEESKKIAPFVKHVHFSDNFGLEHTELPMGMGNVPLKEIMEKLGKKGFESKKIMEAIGWWQHFQSSPFAPTIEGIGTPVNTAGGYPGWNQVPGFYQGYNQGLAGQWLPSTNYELFGAGFSQLPTEFGGQRPGAQGSRMSGRPME